jgi:hypothetical protein
MYIPAGFWYMLATGITIFLGLAGFALIESQMNKRDKK